MSGLASYPSLENVPVVISGGASGIGESLVRHFAAQGATVGFVDIDAGRGAALADELGGQGLVDLIREHSHTCYLGERGALHDWGFGCGKCPACELRAKGWREFKATEA